MRVYDNFKLSSDITKQEYYILGQKQAATGIEMPISSGPRRGGKGNKKNKNCTSKKI